MGGWPFGLEIVTPDRAHEVAASHLWIVIVPAPSPPPSSRPWSCPWGGFVAGFERAAAVWSDPTLKFASAKSFVMGTTRQLIGLEYDSIGDLMRLGFALDWQNTTIAPAPPSMARGGGSVLNRLTDNGTVARPAAVVLRGGPQNMADASAFALSDVFSGSLPIPPHAHENQHGQINWFESHGVPLVASLGYDNRGPADTNMYVVRPADDSFPHAVPHFRANAWNTATLPTIRMAGAAPAGSPVEMSSLTFRIESDGDIVFAAAQLRLDGPRGALLIDDFSNATRWQPPRGTPVTAITMTPPGSAPGHAVPALQWSLTSSGGQAGANFITMRLNRSFSCTDFPTISFFWRLSSNHHVARAVILRTVSSPTSVDYHASELNLQPTLDNVSADGNPAGDAFASMVYGQGWFSFDTSFARQVVLLSAERILVVWDRLTPGDQLAGHQGGPVWHFGPTDPPIVAGDTVLSQGARVNVAATIISLAPRASPEAPGFSAEIQSPGASFEVGVQSTDVWGKNGQKSAYGRVLLTGGRKVDVISVLIPVPNTTTMALVPRCEAELQGGPTAGIIVRVLTHDGTPMVTVRINVTGDGAASHWSVERGTLGG